MAVDRAVIGKFALEAIDGILEGYDESEIEVTEMALVVSIKIPAEPGEEYGKTNVRYFASDHTPHHQLGLLESAATAARFGD